MGDPVGRGDGRSENGGDVERDAIGALKRALADRLVEGRLPRFLGRAVHARIRRDPAWSRHYGVLRTLQRAASVTSAPQRALMKDLLFATPGLGTDAATRAPSRAASGWVGLATACAAVACFVVIREAPGVEDKSLVARGAGQSADAKVGVRARCLDAAGQRVVDEAEGGTGSLSRAPILSCPMDGLIAFSGTNLAAEARFVFVVGVTPDGDVRWYAPFDERARSIEMTAGVVDRVLGAVADTRSMAPDAKVALYALFSTRPVEAQAVRDAVLRAQQSGLNTAALSRLPIDVLAQARIDLVRGARPAGAASSSSASSSAEGAAQE